MPRTAIISCELGELKNHLNINRFVISESWDNGIHNPYASEHANPVICRVIQEMRSYNYYGHILENFLELYYIAIIWMEDGFTLYPVAVTP